jgi:hypothetical protein
MIPAVPFASARHPARSSRLNRDPLEKASEVEACAPKILLLIRVGAVRSMQHRTENADTLAVGARGERPDAHFQNL